MDGISEPCSLCCLEEIVREWMLNCYHDKDIATLHYYDQLKTMIISYCSGMLLKRTSSGMYIDNIMHYSASPLMASITSQSFARSRCCYNSLDIISSTSLYIRNLPPTRIMLVSIFLSQSICLPFMSNGNCRYVPMYNDWPLVVSNEMYDILGGYDAYGKGSCCYPGLNVKVAFINYGSLTYEDCFIMSDRCASRFRYKCYKTIIMPIEDASLLEVGGYINSSHSYWSIPIDGLIESVSSYKDDRMKVVVVYEAIPVSGDKFTTIHGQKGVIVILDHYDMPELCDAPPGYEVPEFIIASSSVYKRSTPGQMIEAKVGLDAKLKKIRVIVNGSCHPNEYPTSRVNISRCDIFRDANESRRISCHYGVIRIQQSCLTSYEKYHYTKLKSNIHTTRTKQSRMKGGSLKLGEMELHQLFGNGMPGVLRELHLRSDMCVTSACGACRRITPLCVCNESDICRDYGSWENKPSINIQLPYSTIEFCLRTAISDDLSIEFVL